MRSIQFRGLSLKTGKWVFGYYAHRRIKNPTGLYTPNHCIFIPDINYGTNGGFWEEIDPSTLGQITFEHDNYGNVIFEGDILKVKDVFDDEFECVVVFEDDYHHAFGLLDKERFWHPFSETIQRSVIGNIHDNPDFFKEIIL